jgi:hypothetical protein
MLFNTLNMHTCRVKATSMNEVGTVAASLLVRDDSVYSHSSPVSKQNILPYTPSLCMINRQVGYNKVLGVSFVSLNVPWHRANVKMTPIYFLLWIPSSTTKVSLLDGFHWCHGDKHLRSISYQTVHRGCC